MSSSSVLVATGSRLFGSALFDALHDLADVRVVALVHDSETVLAESLRHNPDLAVVTTDLPGPGGALGTCSRLMHEERLRTLTLLVSSSEREEHLLAALEAGALGYVTTESDLTKLVDDIRAVIRGEARVPGRMLGAVLRGLVVHQRRSSDLLDRYADLSRRERQILGLLARGHSHVQIADLLVISPETARTHIQKVLSKLGVHSRLEAAALAIEQGWVTPEEGGLQ